MHPSSIKLILFLPLSGFHTENRYKFVELTLAQAMDASQAAGFGGKSIEAGPQVVELGAER
jgi:hypothetical protein